jgi:rubrerythrin
MSLLKAEPAGAVQSMAELFALADAMEREAARRYTELARDMREQGNDAVAVVLEALAREEQGHVASVARWAEHSRGAPPDPAAVRWEPPAPVEPDDAAELSQSRLMTPYRALSMAVRNEERAFAFWCYVAALAEDPEVKRAAETMANEELGHATLLRRERRRAYHAERRPPEGEPERPARMLAAAALERRLAEAIDGIATGGGGGAGRAHALAAETRRMAEEAAALAAAPRLPADGDAETLAERLVEFYLDVAETARDDDALVRAQGLARRAVGRLAWIRALAR